MTSRTEKEMAALLVKFNVQIGPLNNWSSEALESLNDWLTDINTKVEQEWVRRDNNIEADS
ncbi:MAG: hypothetical protein A3B82_00775 [Methylophilales bacterium RIFCSPHIGHO2_02_FULL_57_10]|nr:MAG: hypothetical protein A3B82_00775 [Methylophilales bacterium RIFCSPHIGHO2_02_FULL_57_10]